MATVTTSARAGNVAGALRDLLGADAVVAGSTRPYLSDQTEGQGLRGVADAVVLPASAEEARAAVAWCYANDVAVVPRGGGTGYAGGAVPVEGGVVIGTERLAAIRSFDPHLWRMEVEAGVSTADVQRRARENGLLFPPDPGAAEQSLIGGNIATNAGGPHAFKYGATGSWITGVEAVVSPGDLIAVGGPNRKDVAGYDLKDLLIGSEGTLALITAAWLRFVPAPETALPVYAFYADATAGAAAVEAVLANGIHPAALEFLDGPTLSIAAATFPGAVPDGAAFLVVAEADGTEAETLSVHRDLVEVMGSQALAIAGPQSRAEVSALWSWRDGVSLAVTANRGAKVSEDIVVPVDRLREMIVATAAIGRRHDLETCAWGHAGDGNLHSTLMIDPGDEDQLARARLASQELRQLACDLGGSVSGEHGLGLVRSGELQRQWSGRALDLHQEIKRVFDPKGLFNPGKKLARTGGAAHG